jgi:hypothetical protein
VSETKPFKKYFNLSHLSPGKVREIGGKKREKERKREREKERKREREKERKREKEKERKI